MEIDNDIVAKLVAHRLGREPTEEELAEHRQVQDDAINLSSGVLGTVGGPASKISGMLGKATPEAINVAEQTVPSMAQRIKDAASKSKVRNISSAQDAEANLFKEKYKDAPSFFEKYGKKPEGQVEQVKNPQFDYSTEMAKFMKLKKAMGGE